MKDPKHRQKILHDFFYYQFRIRKKKPGMYLNNEYFKTSFGRPPLNLHDQNKYTNKCNSGLNCKSHE